MTMTTTIENAPVDLNPAMDENKELSITHAPMGSLLNFSLDNYEWAKDYVVNNKTLGPRVSPLLEFGENTTKKVLDASPIKLETVIEAVDTRVDRVVTGTVETTQAVIAAPGNLKNKTLEFTHEKLNLIKIDKDATEADLAVSTIAEDVKVITSERWNMLLDASEGYMAQYLPISEEDKEDIKVEAQKGELKPLAIRSFRQTKLLARRTPEKLFSKVSGITTRTKEAVHVDLIKYSEYLDKQKQNVTTTVYVAWEKVDEKVVQPTKEVAVKSSEAIKNKVLIPVKDRVVAIRLPFHDRIVNIFAVVGDEYETRVVRPRAQIVKMFREELELQQQLAKKESSNDDLTITDGLKAVVAAARTRISKEWEVRAMPTVNQVLGRPVIEEYEEEIEEKSYVDEEDSE